MVHRPTFVTAQDDTCRMTFVRVGGVAGVEVDLSSPGAIEFFEPNHRDAAIQACVNSEVDYVSQSCERLLGKIIGKLGGPDDGTVFGHDDDAVVHSTPCVRLDLSSAQLLPGKHKLLAATVVSDHVPDTAVCRGLVGVVSATFRARLFDSSTASMDRSKTCLTCQPSI